MQSIKSLCLLLAIFIFVGCENDNEQAIVENAQYKVTFRTIWSEETHPFEFPVGAHFSGTIGLTHKAYNPIFTSGKLATNGIKVMAETGRKDPLIEEINTHIVDEVAGRIISGGGISLSPKSISEEFIIQPDFPLVTIVSMLAPSPDWFVAVENVALLEGGSWVLQKTVPVFIYDAGTDAGTTFQSADVVESIQKMIAPITSEPLATNGSVNQLGEFVFELLEK